MSAIKFNTIPQLSKVTNELTVFFDDQHRAALEKLIDKSRDRGDGRIHVEITRPYRKRTSRERGQNRRFRGHCRDIAAQITTADGEPLHTQEQIAEAIKRMAVDEGYPWRVSIDGLTEPKSTSEVTVEEMQVLLEVQQRFADEHELWLTEYDDNGLEFKAIAGEPI